MNYINMPNIPEKSVRLAMVDGRISTSLEAGLQGKGIELIKTKPHLGLYPAISYHPDAIFHHLGERKIVYAPGADEGVLGALSARGFLLIKGETELGPRYPGSVHYNAARVGNLVFHNTKYTDRVLKNNLIEMDIELVHIKQGYAKCAISVVDESSIITMDIGIAKVAEKKGIDVLVIEEDAILLPGFNNGFIGGCTGLIGKGMWAVAGNVRNLKSYKRIEDFLLKKGVEIVSLFDGPVVDIGTIIPLLTD
ncbi:DUF6873 family GME fold protein [Acetivibrio mesophilus]|uniref:DUF6873 domain-containing protein n=1 Tax=Acetivibrio mesophilus TaxID=2487273 RepID=A0A4Q0I681_9FIRM|nr:hypothetical protein [Acetivibrio mesophilus]ODM26809.1 hypothetical protein A7W90_11635 [Clostridium sp. Bc-iso-3]RXE59325.1 hypothetical protein EFD62_08125 [Acetivibrio mesophilus]HHV28402.1 hypothetical protein [Clostridium sp.]